MRYVYDDGGRTACGFKGDAGDCVARAISIVTQRSYSQVYSELAAINSNMRKTKARARSVGKKTAREGIYTTSQLFKEYMEKLGFKWVACMKPGTGCKVHLKNGELPMGRLVVRVSRHLTAVIDGVIYDTFDPSREGTRCVYGYWIPKWFGK